DVADNVFAVSGRINSTWGGGLVDMVRSRRLLEIMERHDYLTKSGPTGAWLLGELQRLATKHPKVQNVRGRGLMVAFDLPDDAVRNDVLTRLTEQHRVLALPSGNRAIRFRPA